MSQRTTFHADTPLHALLVEQALLLARQLESTAQDAPDGQVLARVEALAVPAARELARQAVLATLQTQTEQAEKKGRRAAPVSADAASGTKATAAGLAGWGCGRPRKSRRMKQTGARWRVRRANRMVTLCCTFHGDTWTPYWEHRLN